MVQRFLITDAGKPEVFRIPALDEKSHADVIQDPNMNGWYKVEGSHHSLKKVQAFKGYYMNRERAVRAIMNYFWQRKYICNHSGDAKVAKNRKIWNEVFPEMFNDGTV